MFLLFSVSLYQVTPIKLSFLFSEILPTKMRQMDSFFAGYYASQSLSLVAKVEQHNIIFGDLFV